MIKTNIHTIDAIVDNLGRQICGFNLLNWQIYWKNFDSGKKGIPVESIQGTYKGTKK